tara:strand:- start:155 stop:301 length:147 start_codon:yes stop_codon:yes gene_type:complete
MKWEGYNDKAADRMNDVLAKVFKGRSLLVLTALTALVVTAAASWKWGG